MSRRARLREGAEFFRVSFARLPDGSVVWAHFDDDEPEGGSIFGYPNGMAHIASNLPFSAEPPKPPTLDECLNALAARLGRTVQPREARRRRSAARRGA